MKLRPYKQGEVVARGECITNGFIVNSEELRAAEARAKELAQGLNLVTSEERHWYGETYSTPAVDWSGVALLLARVKDDR
jgi:putative protein kinase ArgK-like GTPase of G3E family